MQHRRVVTLRALLVASASFAFIPGAFAQIEEITVTATKTGETDLQKTAIAISAFTADAVDRSQMFNVKDLAQFAPNVSIPQNSTFAQIYIRGVGSNNVFLASDPSSTVHVDGVYYARPYAQFASFLDVERIEVLRGPQGTLYGRNSVGGTINVVSRKPSDKIEAKVQAGYGNYDQVNLDGYVSGPLIEGKLQGSVSVSYADHDPYRENIIATGNDIDDQHTGAGRVQLRFLPSDNVEMLTRADISAAEEVPMGFAKILFPLTPGTNSILGDFKKVAMNVPARSTRRSLGISEDIAVEFGEGLTFKSQTAYRENYTKSRSDTDSSELDTTISNIREENDQFSQEFNLTGNVGPVDFVTGLYYFDENIASNSAIEQRVPRTQSRIAPTVDTHAYAAYGQGTYHLSEQFSFTGGLRYTIEKKTFRQNGGVFNAATNVFNPGFPVVYTLKDDYYGLTPKIGIEYSPSEELMFYASATRGFKSGGFNFSIFTPATQSFGPEKLWSYEAGVKSEWLNNRLRVNAAAFHYDYNDLQVQAFITAGVTSISNAATAKVRGIELEITAQPVDGLDLTANLAHLDATYTDYPGATLPRGVIGNATGNRLNASPKYTANLAAQYTVPVTTEGSVFGRVEYFYTDRQYFLPSNTYEQSQGAYSVLNASAGYQTDDGQWRFTVYGKNITDTEYVTITAAISTVTSGRPGAPATYGARVAWKY